MDPAHFEKIADQLMQFRGKLPDSITLVDMKARWIIDEMKNRIDFMLLDIDRLAAIDEKGWIR
jgi:hypothetical protein